MYEIYLGRAPPCEVNSEICLAYMFVQIHYVVKVKPNYIKHVTTNHYSNHDDYTNKHYKHI